MTRPLALDALIARALRSRGATQSTVAAAAPHRLTV
jgi:hypothetical protein